jgi:hypothetical protein
MAEEFVQEQQVEQPQKKKKKEEQKTGFPVGRQFDPGKVFGPEAAKEEDLEVDLSKFKAQHGEGGTRGFSGDPSGHYDMTGNTTGSFDGETTHFFNGETISGVLAGNATLAAYLVSARYANYSSYRERAKK